MLKRILLPLDGSVLADCVLPHTAAIAQAMDANVVFLHVLEPEKGHPSDPLDWQLRKLEAEMHLQEVEDSWRSLGLASETVLLEGKAADRIIEYAHEAEVDLIVVSSHGQSGLTGWSISSVGQKLIHRLRKSIMVVPAYQTEYKVEKGGYGRILVPLDGSLRAESVLPVACKLAHSHEASLLVAHVVTPPEMMQRTPLSAEDAWLVEELVSRNRQKASQYFDELRSRLPCEVETHLINGEDVTTALHDLVKQAEIDLVILTAHGSSGKGQRPYGSIVTNFIEDGTATVLVLQDLPADEIELTEAEIAAQEIEQGTRSLTLQTHTLTSVYS
jgi:nucleotide-binding universal stress UspA family protein